MAGLLALLHAAATAYESDVHYGMTHWLARQAGFDASQAEWIAVADQRIDGGLIDTMELALEYACAGRFPELALQAQQRRYPAAVKLPAPAEARGVVPGGEPAREPLAALHRQVRGKEGLMLSRLGEALHTLQDSWSHQGVPGQPASATVGCDAQLFGGHAAARGGADSHEADLTHADLAAATTMARATYEALQAYPPVQGRVRQPAAWEAVLPPLQALLRASSKTAKREWFVAQGMADTGFLEGISLPDGAAPGPLRWAGHKLPPMPPGGSTQHDADPGLRGFYDGLLTRWLGSEPLDGVVAELGPDADDGPRPPRASAAARQLAARLKLWKLKDHGSAAGLAHAAGPLSAAQLRSVDKLAQPQALLVAASLAEALFPLQQAGPLATPVLPYIVRPLDGGRFIAIARLRHAPYDSVGWIAERRGGRWALVDMVSVVDQ